MNPPRHPKIEAAGIAWYRREDCSLLLALFEESDVLPKTFDEGLANTETTEREVSETGLRVSRVLFILQEFNRWGDSQGLRTDGEGRGRFGSGHALKYGHAA